MKRTSFAWTTTLALAALSGCGKPAKAVKTTVPICSAVRPLTKTNKVRPLRPEEWYHLIVDRSLEGGSADCTGASLTWQPVEGCLESYETGDPLPPRAFREEDLVLQRVDETTRAVWVITDRFKNGDGMGPVALVSEGDQTMDVIAVGTLRARARRARLKLMTIGKSELLQAEGEACERDDDPSTCRRSAVFLQRDRNRLQPLRLYARNGTCIGPAIVHMARQKILPLPDGWSRRLELHSTMVAQTQRIVVTEQVVVSDFDPSRPGVPPRPVRRADAEILLWFGKDGRLLASDASLWSRILEQIGKGQ